MTDNENSFTHEGDGYVAVDELMICNGCAFYMDDKGECTVDRAMNDGLTPSCRGNKRKDGLEKIFKKKVES